MTSSASAPIFGAIPEGVWVRSGEDDTAPLQDFADIISGRRRKSPPQNNNTNNASSSLNQDSHHNHQNVLQHYNAERRRTFAALNLMGSSQNNEEPQQSSSELNINNNPDSKTNRNSISFNINNNNTNNNNPTPKYTPPQLQTFSPISVAASVLAASNLSTNNNQSHQQQQGNINPFYDEETGLLLSPDEVLRRKQHREMQANEKLLSDVDDLVARHHLLRRRPGLKSVRDQQPGFYVRDKFRLAQNDKQKLRPATPLYVVMQRLLNTKVTSFCSAVYAVWFIVKIRQLLLKTEVQERILGRLKEGEVRRAAKARVLARKFYGASSRSMALHVKKQRQNMKSILKDGIQQSERRLAITKFDRKATDPHDEEAEDEENDDEDDDDEIEEDDEDENDQEDNDDEMENERKRKQKILVSSNINSKNINSSASAAASWKVKTQSHQHKMFRSRNDPLRKSSLFNIRFKPEEDHLFDRSRYEASGVFGGGGNGGNGGGGGNGIAGTSGNLPLYLRKTSFVNIIEDQQQTSQSQFQQSSASSFSGSGRRKSDITNVGGASGDEQKKKSSTVEFGEVLFASSNMNNNNKKDKDNKRNISPPSSSAISVNPFTSQEFKKRENQSQTRLQNLTSEGNLRKLVSNLSTLSQSEKIQREKEWEMKKASSSATNNQQQNEKEVSSSREPTPATAEGSSSDLATNTKQSSSTIQPQQSQQQDDPSSTIVPRVKDSIISKASIGKLPITKNIFLWHFCWRDEPFEPPHPSLPSLATTAEKLSNLKVNGNLPASSSSPNSGGNSPNNNNIVLPSITQSLRERDATKYVTQVRPSELAVFASTKQAPDLVKDLISLQNCFASHESSGKKHGVEGKVLEEAESLLQRSKNLGKAVAKEKEIEHEKEQRNSSASPEQQQQQQSNHQYHTPRKPPVPTIQHKRQQAARKEAIIASKTSATFEPFALHFGMEHSTFVRRSLKELSRQIESHRDIFSQKRELFMTRDHYTRRYQAHLQSVDNAVRKRLTDRCDDEIKQYCLDWFNRLKNKVANTMNGGLNESMVKVFDAFEPVFKTGILTPQLFEKTTVLKLYGKHLLERSSKKTASVVANNAISPGQQNLPMKQHSTLSSNNNNNVKRGASYFASSSSISSTITTSHHHRNQANVSPLASATPPPPPPISTSPQTTNHQENTIIPSSGSSSKITSPLQTPGTQNINNSNHNTTHHQNTYNSYNTNPDPFRIPVLDGLLVAPTNEECVLVDLGAQFVLMRLRIPFNVSQERAKEIISRSGANYSLMEAEDVDIIYRHEARLGKARVQRIGRLDEVIERNNQIERMVEEGRKLAEKRIWERRHLTKIVTAPSGGGGLVGASSSSISGYSSVSGRSSSIGASSPISNSNINNSNTNLNFPQTSRLLPPISNKNIDNNNNNKVPALTARR